MIPVSESDRNWDNDYQQGYNNSRVLYQRFNRHLCASSVPYALTLGNEVSVPAGLALIAFGNAFVTVLGNRDRISIPFDSPRFRHAGFVATVATLCTMKDHDLNQRHRVDFILATVLLAGAVSINTRIREMDIHIAPYEMVVSMIAMTCFGRLMDPEPRQAKEIMFDGWCVLVASVTYSMIVGCAFGYMEAVAGEHENTKEIMGTVNAVVGVVRRTLARLW